MNKDIIRKYIKESLEMAITRKYIKEIVTEELMRQMNEEDTQSSDMKRKAVMSALKDPKYNKAQLAYALGHPKDQSEKDTLRSEFSKKATGKPDNDGVVRQFDDEDINALYQMIRKR